MVKLPLQRTLHDYTYIAKVTAGFSHEVDTQLAEAARIDSCPEREKHILLIMDEMHIQEDIVYDCNTGTCMCVYM